MKLHNKKTGQIVDLSEGIIKDTYGGEAIQIKPVAVLNKDYLYYSLAELNEEWEDAKPAEPLIKDEKVRKAVRAWAILNRIDEVNYCLNDEDGSSFIYTTEASSLVLDFCFEIEELKFGKAYTIAELCGEEEE